MNISKLFGQCATIATMPVTTNLRIAREKALFVFYLYVF